MDLDSIRTRVTIAYGFLANPSYTVNHNVSIQFDVMPIWHYFSRGINMEMHDLTKSPTTIPKHVSALIGLGMKFCPIEKL